MAKRDIEGDRIAGEGGKIRKSDRKRERHTQIDKKTRHSNTKIERDIQT
jgi:hypothetical protein